MISDKYLNRPGGGSTSGPSCHSPKSQAPLLLTLFFRPLRSRSFIQKHPKFVRDLFLKKKKKKFVRDLCRNFKVKKFNVKIELKISWLLKCIYFLRQLDCVAWIWFLIIAGFVLFLVYSKALWPWLLKLCYFKFSTSFSYLWFCMAFASLGL